MKKIIVIFLMILTLMSFLGCRQNPSVSSVTDDLYMTDNFDELLVMFNVSNLELKMKTEDIISNKLSERGIRNHKSYKLIPPTRQYDEEEFQERMAYKIQENNIDGIIFITIDNITSDSEKIQTDTTGMEDGFSKGFLEGLSGTNVNQISMDIGLRVFNVSSGGYAWYGTLRESDRSFSGEPEIINVIENASEALIDKLENDKVI